MEEVFLQEMVRDREIQIGMIRKKLEDQEKKLELTKKSLEETKKIYTENHLSHQMELDELMQKQSKLLSQYKDANEELDLKKQQQGPQLQVYNEVMSSLETAEGDEAAQDSSYVTRMQAQLCKAMHSMGMVETQLALSTTQVEGLQKQLRESKTTLIEDKTQVELKLMNDLVLADNARKEVSEKVTKQTEEFTAQKDALLEKFEEQQEQQDEEKEGEEEEEEEEDDEEEKAELTEILVEGREEIARLEAENAKEKAKLEELKQKVIALKGEELVDALCAQIAEDCGVGTEEAEEE
ncbi:unnamed protein product [Cylindrotheca closterium]|uniref:Uncharacterized protein n=1 Tax=Cylindrotheca closterium TaxID=2856 RepID=A0AAD2FLQ5_9STRA|nr:unnamed protein product [Cylindrotheca closterium]